MARRKCPEQTRERILDAAEELFGAHGYDATSIQDIVDHLDGLTKGAIYHHFTSKEDILDAVTTRVADTALARQRAVLDDVSLTGAERIARLLGPEVTAAQVEPWHRMIPNPDPVRQARLLAYEYQASFQVTAAAYLQPLIEAGLADGSVTCDHPAQAAEVLAVLANLWLVPLFRTYDGPDSLRARIDCFERMAAALGVPLDHDTLFATADELIRIYGDDPTPAVPGHPAPAR